MRFIRYSFSPKGLLSIALLALVAARPAQAQIVAQGFESSAADTWAYTPARKNRSDDKGPEPEGVVIGSIRDTAYAFVSLERVGGVAIFNVNDPANPRLVDYLNNRSLTAGTGDLGPEGTLFISAASSPTGQPLLLLANEMSSNIAVYGIRPHGVLAARNGVAAAPLQLYPNPAQGGAVRLSRPVSGQLLDVLGRPVR